MNWEEHAAISKMLLGVAAPLAQNPRTALAAGELIWGAAVHAFSAVAGHPSERHRQPRTRKEFLRIIDGINDGHQSREDLITGLGVTQRRLHDHFYTGRFSDNQLADSIGKGTAFVNRLLHVAGQSGDGGGNAATA